MGGMAAGRASRVAVSGPPARPLAARFTDEGRHDEWADRREEEIRQRIEQSLRAAAIGVSGPAAAAVRPGAVECRSRICRVALSSTEPRAIARAVERLSGERGFHRWASDTAIETVDRAVGGPREVKIYLRFAR